MTRPPRTPRSPARLTLRLGRWLEADATGWGIVAVPVVVLLALGGFALRLWLA
jgi:hypothetical protein